MKRFFAAAWVGALLLGASFDAKAAIVWDESLDGDLSTLPGAPTSLGSLAAGESEFLGTTVNDLVSVDRDYLTFTIAAGHSLTNIMLNDYQAPGDDVGFIGLYAGSTASTPPGVSPTLTELLGGTHVDATAIGDIFPAIESLFGLDKFDRPLGPGDYTLLIQQTGVESTQYRIGLVTVPEPSPLGVLPFAFFGLVLARPRSR